MPRLHTRATIGGLAIVLAACAAAPAAAGNGPVRPQEAPVYAYVCSQDEAMITVIDLTTQRVVEEIHLTELGFTPNAKPHHVAVEPDGSFWYVSLIGENRVLKFDRDNTLVGRVDFEVPGMLALDADADMLFAGRSMSAVNPPARLGEFSTDGMRADEVDVFFPRPHALALSPDGARIYTASLAENQLATVDRETGDVELTNVDQGGHGAHGEHGHMIAHFGIAPDGDLLVATTEMTGLLLFFDLSGDGLPKADGQMELGQRPWLPVFSPDGGTLYLAVKDANAVDIIDVASRQVRTRITHPAISEPHGAALSPDGRWLIVTNNNTKGAYASTRRSEKGGGPVGTAVIIDTGSNEVVEVIEVGANPTGVGVRPGA
ncbi:MAG: YncE family protein [Gemmatimonadota bacterium]|nr:YncE family protein [Gemmatimonadota bacterium]